MSERTLFFGIISFETKSHYLTSLRIVLEGGLTLRHINLLLGAAFIERKLVCYC